MHQSLTQRKPNFEVNFASQNKYFVRVSMQVRVTAQLNAHCNIIEVVNPKDRLMCGITEMRLSANDPCINHSRKVIGALLRSFRKMM